MALSSPICINKGDSYDGHYGHENMVLIKKRKEIEETANLSICLFESEGF